MIKTEAVKIIGQLLVIEDIEANKLMKVALGIAIDLDESVENIAQLMFYSVLFIKDKDIFYDEFSGEVEVDIDKYQICIKELSLYRFALWALSNLAGCFDDDGIDTSNLIEDQIWMDIIQVALTMEQYLRIE